MYFGIESYKMVTVRTTTIGTVEQIPYLKATSHPTCAKTLRIL